MDDRRREKAQTAFKNTVIDRLSDHRKLLNMYTSHLQAVSEKLAPPNEAGQNKEPVIPLFLSVSNLLESICEKACGAESWTWWKDPDNCAAGFDAFLSSSFLSQHELSEWTRLSTGLALLQESLLHLFFADSYKVAITYSGFADSKVDRRRELWNCDARKARRLASQIARLSLGNQALNDSLQWIITAAEHLETLRPSEEVAEFEYVYTELTFGQSCAFLPKSALAKSKTVPLRKGVGGTSALSTGVLGKGVTYVSYPVFSAYCNTLELADYIEFLSQKGIYGNISSLWNDGVTRLSKAEDETQDQLAQQKRKPLNAWPVFIFDAVAIGDVELVKESLRCGEDLNRKNDKGWTPFLVAVANDSLDVARFLRDENADIQQNLPDGQTAMMLATKKGSRAMIEFLLPYDDTDWQEIIQNGRETVRAGGILSCGLLIAALVLAASGRLVDSTRAWSLRTGLLIMACITGLFAIFLSVVFVHDLCGLMRSRKMQSRYEAIKREIRGV